MIETTVQGVITGFMMGAIYALIALGLSVIFGVMNVVNFAHGDFVMFSMYLTYTIGTAPRLGRGANAAAHGPDHVRFWVADLLSDH